MQAELDTAIDDQRAMGLGKASGIGGSGRRRRYDILPRRDAECSRRGACGNP